MTPDGTRMSLSVVNPHLDREEILRLQFRGTSPTTNHLAQRHGSWEPANRLRRMTFKLRYESHRGMHRLNGSQTTGR